MGMFGWGIDSEMGVRVHKKCCVNFSDQGLVWILFVIKGILGWGSRTLKGEWTGGIAGEIEGG